MTESPVQAFFKLVDQNKAIRGQVARAHAEAVVSVAAQHGLTFSVEDYARAAMASTRPANRELNDTDLASVAGGEYQWDGQVPLHVDWSLITTGSGREPEKATPIQLPRHR